MGGIAGSVAPVFRDEGYAATLIYDFYHAIIHNNKLYFCRQDGTIGHEPQGASDEFWFLSLDGTFADAASLGGESAEQWQKKIDNLLNGTTPTGDSDKLGGKGASEYALEEQIKSNSIWNELTSGFDLNNAFGKYRTPNGGIISSLLNLPSAWTAGELSVDYIPFNSANTYGVQILTYKFNSTVSVYQRTKNSATWGAWEKLATTADLANYPPLTQSNSSVITRSTNTPVIYDNVADGGTTIFNAFRLSGALVGFLGFDGANKPSFKDTSGNMKDLLHSGNVADYALSINGGTLSNGKSTPLILSGTSGEAYLRYNGGNIGFGYLGFNGRNNPVFVTADGNIDYPLHHDGNSAKVVQATSAPSDTTVVWVDTANKVAKIYKDGAWTALT